MFGDTICSAPPLMVEAIPRWTPDLNRKAGLKKIEKGGEQTIHCCVMAATHYNKNFGFVNFKRLFVTLTMKEGSGIFVNERGQVKEIYGGTIVNVEQMNAKGWLEPVNEKCFWRNTIAKKRSQHSYVLIEVGAIVSNLIKNDL